MEDTHKALDFNQQSVYQIKVEGQLDVSWSEWFDDMAIEQADVNATVTTLTGVVADQAALHGILQKICYLNLPLLSVIRIDTGSVGST